MKVACLIDAGSRRSRHIAGSMARGICNYGDQAVVIGDHDARLQADVLVAYGWRAPHLFHTYVEAGRSFIYIDLGWWDRKPPGAALDGYHKVLANSRDGNPAISGASSDRFEALGIPIAPWTRGGTHILLAGMSRKSAETRGMRPGEWEEEAIAKIRLYTDRPIVYRPKPSWTEAAPIAGTIYDRGTPLEDSLRDCWAVVTYHSNVAIDGLLAGLPVHVVRGPASSFSTPLELIEAPCRDGDRARLMADIAYRQWRPAEMASGACWRHIRQEINR